MMINKKSSIEKIDEQINMLKNKKFVDKPKTIKVKKVNQHRKEILEEPTIEDDLMKDLISNDEKTKVYGKKSITTKEVSNVNTITKKIEKSDNKKINYDKLYDVYLPIIVFFLIVVFLILIIFI